MIKSINKTPAILEKLAAKKRILNTPEDIAALERIQKNLDKVHEDAKRKQALSEQSAWKVPLD